MEEQVVVPKVVHMLSLMEMGTPARRPGFAPLALLAMWASARAAFSRARSLKTELNAWRGPLSFSMAASANSVASTLLVLPAAMASRTSRADMEAKLVMDSLSNFLGGLSVQGAG